ncbi:hypothetical protein GFL51_29645 [Rhizobium leguminosarum bv. viciae]|nr:hypothetical protein [Rhizobium leguminosarum bv. viciae]
MRRYPFAPRAGRRCRQADEGRMRFATPWMARSSNTGIAAAVALFMQTCRARFSSAPVSWATPSAMTGGRSRCFIR